MVENLQGYEVTDEILAELGMPSLAELAARKSRAFVKGPLPLAWIHRADVAPHTLATAMAVKLLIDMACGREPVQIADRLWKLLGMDVHSTRKRTLDALEGAGIIRVERSSGKPTLIWLVDKP